MKAKLIALEIALPEINYILTLEERETAAALALEAQRKTGWLAYIEWLAPTIGILRLFAEPVGPLAEGGQPAKEWAWTCVVELEKEGTEMRLHASLVVPPSGGRASMAMACKAAGATSWTWDRWEPAGVRHVTFPIHK